MLGKVRPKASVTQTFFLGLGALASVGAASANTLDLKADCHAAGDDLTDDSPALKMCLEQLEVSALRGRPSSLRIPTGIFRIGGSAGTMPVLSRGVTIMGYGPHASTLRLDPDYAGDLLAWDEAWTGSSAGADKIDLASDATGPTVTGLRITGNRAAPHRQNALTFYDRNDHVLLRDVEIAYLNGNCLTVGQTRRTALAYLRESSIFNLKCFSTGASNQATVTLSSMTRPGSDATDQVDVYKLAVFDAAGQGVAIRNPHMGSATRTIRFYGLRIEKTEAEGLSIGDPRDRGQIAAISLLDFTVVNAKAAALRITAGVGAPQPYNIRVTGGAIGPGNARGVEIDSGRQIEIALDSIDAPIILGPSAGADITIQGNGAESSWRFAGTIPPGSGANPLEIRSPFSLRGLPATGDRVGAVALRADLQGAETRAMTMDGQTPNAYNCINTQDGQTYSLGLRVMVQDRDAAARSFNWVMPAATLSAWYGPHSARVTPGSFSVVQNQADGAWIGVGADTTNGCLSLMVHAPPPHTDHWAATGLVTYARAP